MDLAVLKRVERCVDVIGLCLSSEGQSMLGEDKKGVVDFAVLVLKRGFNLAVFIDDDLWSQIEEMKPVLRWNFLFLRRGVCVLFFRNDERQRFRFLCTDADETLFDVFAAKFGVWWTSSSEKERLHGTCSLSDLHFDLGFRDSYVILSGVTYRIDKLSVNPIKLSLNMHFALIMDDE